MTATQRENGRRERRDPRASISGSMAEMGTVDLVQTLEAGKRTGVLRVLDRGRSAAVWFRQGRIVDAELGRRRAEAAFYRLLRWREGEFTVDFGPIDRAERIRLGTQALLLEGIRRADEWERLLARLPPLDAVYEVDAHLVLHRRAALPEGIGQLLGLFDGRRTLGRVLEESDEDDLVAGAALVELFADGVIRSARAREAADGTPDPEAVDWFSEPAEPRAAAPEPARASPPDPSPRVVHFPTPPRRAAARPAASSPEPRRAPTPPPPAITVTVPPAAAIAASSTGGAAAPAQSVASDARRLDGRRALIVALLAAAALAGAGLGAWKVLAERPTELEATPPSPPTAAEPVSAPATEPVSKPIRRSTGKRAR